MPRLAADTAHRKKTSDGELSRLVRIFSYTPGPSELLVPFSPFSKCLLHPDELAKLKHLIRTTDTRIPLLPVSLQVLTPLLSTRIDSTSFCFVEIVRKKACSTVMTLIVFLNY